MFLLNKTIEFQSVIVLPRGFISYSWSLGKNVQKLLEHYGSIWEIRPYGQAHGDCSTFLHFGYSQGPMGAHGGRILPIPASPPPCWGFWAAPPGCGMARNGVSGRRAPGCQMARNPEFSGFLAIPHPETPIFRRRVGWSKVHCFIFLKTLSYFS